MTVCSQLSSVSSISLRHVGHLLRHGAIDCATSARHWVWTWCPQVSRLLHGVVPAVLCHDEILVPPFLVVFLVAGAGHPCQRHQADGTIRADAVEALRVGPAPGTGRPVGRHSLSASAKNWAAPWFRRALPRRAPRREVIRHCSARAPSGAGRKISCSRRADH